MRKNFVIAQKIFSVFASFNLILQSIFGSLLLSPSFSFAQEVTPVSVEETVVAENLVTETPVEPAVEPISEPTVEPTSQPTSEPTSEPTLQPTPTPTIEPVSEPTPTLDLTIQEPTPSASVEPTIIPTVTSEITPIPAVEGTNTESNNPPPPNETNPPEPTPTEILPTPTVVVEEPKVQGQLSAMIVENVAAPSLDLSAAEEMGACLVTDKADYAPTDSVLITGTSFSPNTEYTLVISSTDEPALNFESKVTTNENGTLIFAYQLDGNYRPNYKVEVKVGGFVVASVTFTDTISPAIS